MRGSELSDADCRPSDDDRGCDETVVSVEVPDGFHVDNEEKASWAVRKIVEARAHAARVKDWATRELQRAERDEQWLLRRFGCELEAWLRAELQRRGGRRRSVSLPDGILGVRLQPARLEIVDARQLVIWCERHVPEALRVTVEAEGALAGELARWHRSQQDATRLQQQVLREPLNHHFSESGELPDGAALKPAEERLYIK